MDDVIWENIVDELHDPLFLVDKITGRIKYANKSAKNTFPQLVKLGKANILFEELNGFTKYSVNKHILDKLKTIKLGENAQCKIIINGGNANAVLQYKKKHQVILKIETTQSTSLQINSNASSEFLEIINSIVEGINQLAFHRYDKFLSDALAKIGKYFKCERAYIFNYSDDENFVSVIRQWTKSGIIPFSEWKDMPLVHFSHIGGSLIHDKVYCVNTLSDIPDSAEAERHGLMTEGVKSVLLVSFRNKMHAMGFVGIDMVSEERQWTSEEVEHLTLFSSLVANIQIKQKDYLRKNFQEAMANMLFEESAWATGIFKDEILIDCNNQTLDLLKGKKQEVIGKSVYDLTYSDGSDKVEVELKLKKLIARSKLGEIPVDIWNVCAIDGSVEQVELTFQTFEFEGGHYLAVTAKDIKKQIEKEKELLRKQKYLESKLDVILSPSQKISKVKLLDLLNKEQLFKLTKAFSDATGLASAILDEGGQEISSVTTSNGVCDLIRSSEKGMEVCQLSGKLLNAKIRSSLQPEWQHCLSCSFLDAAAPIIINDQMVGSWWVGRALPHDADIDRVIKYGRELGIDEYELSDAFSKQKRIGKKDFENSLHLLRVLANELSNLAYNNLKLAKAIKSHQRMERRLERAKKKAEESDKLKSAFLANMSHEIRTPMNGIIGFSELIQSPNLEAEDRSNYISIIQESSNQLLNIINDIIDISKIEAGQIEANYELVNLRVLLEELLLFYQPIAKQKNIRLLMDCSINKKHKLNVDRIKLKQVFSNLIGNAIKFTDEGCVKFGCCNHDKKEYNFYVQDTGIGIDKKDQKQIFSRFWQVSKKSNNSGGTGLGLTITRAYVELMGGKVWLESRPEQGTQFKFSIPKT